MKGFFVSHETSNPTNILRAYMWMEGATEGGGKSAQDRWRNPEGTMH
jgi:hypothetical protein